MLREPGIDNTRQRLGEPVTPAAGRSAPPTLPLLPRLAVPTGPDDLRPTMNRALRNRHTLTVSTLSDIGHPFDCLGRQPAAPSRCRPHLPAPEQSANRWCVQARRCRPPGASDPGQGPEWQWGRSPRAGPGGSPRSVVDGEGVHGGLAVGGVGQAVAADGFQASVAGEVGDQDESLPARTSRVRPVWRRVCAEARSSAC